MSDLIRRRDAVSKMSDLLMVELQGQRLPTWNEVYRAMNDIPSAEPERKKGEWIKEDLSGYLTPGGNSIYHCSECGHTEGPWPHPRLTNFCPSCGADMRGEDGKA